MELFQYWKEIGVILFPIITYVLGKNRQKILDRKEIALAKQEEIKAQKEDVSLSEALRELNNKIFNDLSKRIESLEEKNVDLFNKYHEVQLRNAILEEKASTYEDKYKSLEKNTKNLKKSIYSCTKKIKICEEKLIN